jgi:hypothetical protein
LAGFVEQRRDLPPGPQCRHARGLSARPIARCRNSSDFHWPRHMQSGQLGVESLERLHAFSLL